MGWKASTIIIGHADEIDSLQLLSDMGFADLNRIEGEPFEVAINPPKNTVYIGHFKNNLIISVADLPLTLIEKVNTQIERVLIDKFPATEICSIVLHSGVNLWGYSVIQNGKRIRARTGSSMYGTTVEFGEPLEEEMELLNKSSIDKNGERVYHFENSPNVTYKEDGVGEIFVFEVCRRYFGFLLDRGSEPDELLFETILQGYGFSTCTFSGTGERLANSGLTSKHNLPWWKFW